MSTREYLKFYGDDKYWNLDVKEDFLNQTRTLWRNNTNKYEGGVFYINHRASEENALTVR